MIILLWVVLVVMGFLAVVHDNQFMSASANIRARKCITDKRGTSHVSQRLGNRMLSPIPGAGVNRRKNPQQRKSTYDGVCPGCGTNDTLNFSFEIL